MDGVRSSHPDKRYQRTYKACIPCRQRKAKCDLGTGPDGLPIGPPCARCRRELRECVFPEKRAWERSRKRARSPESCETDVSPRNSSQLTTTSPDTSILAQGRIQNLHHAGEVTSSTPENNFQPEWPYHRDGGESYRGPLDRPSIGSSRTDQSHSHLYENNQHRSNSTLASSMMRTVVSSGNDALNILFEAATAQEEISLEARSESLAGPPSAGPSTQDRQDRTPGNNESAFESMARVTRPVKLSDATQDTLNVWEACRFVKMGLFTAREAVTFTDLFYENMSCLSPILTDFYANHRYHHWLITREPVLCCTILMISSRYHVLPGAGGESRNFFIHHRLWSHCQKLTMRLIFGQEKTTKSKVRSLGTVEALLLMSEWHPRALHFPPETDGWDDDLITAIPNNHDNIDSSSAPGSRGVEDIIEPARRSDQMSWMLLGCALSLAHELGIFETEGSTSPSDEPEWGDQMAIRWQRVQRLLYVYINHTWLTFMDSWIELTKLAKSVTDMFFPSAAFARQLLHSGRYVGLLEHFRPLLNQWKDKFLQPQVLDKAFYNDLFIEYHFVRVYTHSVGMQAVVERAVAENGPNNFDGVRPMTIDPTDYEYIQEVIYGCGQILQKVTHLAEAGALRFSPVRIVLRITSASIFLMKALSLGTRQAKLQESIQILERSIKALKSNALDDVHLSTRYAALLEMHVSRLRGNLLASSKVVKSSQDAPGRSSMGPPPWPDNGDRPNLSRASVLQDPPPAMGYIPSLNDIGADNWLSLPFDPSMAPFDMSHGCQFPMYEGGTLDFLSNLPS
ncbi:hypothetical protein PDIDSM_5668 [Penicillium digitatum]|nr:hypothetical protein PDIDSM_5668 [Penicillium digitatum]